MGSNMSNLKNKNDALSFSSNKFLYAPLAVAVSLYSASGWSAGFQISEHSASGLGRANAGNGAIAEDASVVASNPALMTQLTQPELTVVGAYILPDVAVEGSSLPNGLDASDEDVAPDAFVPAFYYVARLNDRLTAGIGAFSQFGLTSQYSNDFASLEVADRASITTFTINPSMAYKFNDQLSVGFGLDVIAAKAELNTSVPSYLQPAMGGGDLLGMEGSGYDIGWNLGVSWQPLATTTVGFSYRSGYDITLEGEANSNLVAAYNNDGDLVLSLPDVTDLSVAHQFNDQFQLSASVTYTNWERFDSLEADIDGVGTVHIKEENWNGAYRYAVGGSYQHTPDLTFRAGIAYDESPVAEENRSLSIPDSNRIWYSAGANMLLSETMDLDLAYTHIDGEKVDVYETSSIGTVFEGTSEGNADIVAVQLNVKL